MEILVLDGCVLVLIRILISKNDILQHFPLLHKNLNLFLLLLNFPLQVLLPEKALLTLYCLSSPPSTTFSCPTGERKSALKPEKFAL